MSKLEFSCLGWRNQGIGHQIRGALLDDEIKLFHKFNSYFTRLTQVVKDENENKKYFA